MMKTKFKAGLVATLISLVVVVGAAIMLTAWSDGDPGDRMIKIIAFGVIGIWLGLYAWLKPKPTAEEQKAEERKQPARENEIKTKI